MERTWRGKTHWNRLGTVNVLSPGVARLPLRAQNEHANARYQITVQEAATDAKLFHRLAPDILPLALALGDEAEETQ
jgi:hypothetical protein